MSRTLLKHFLSALVVFVGMSSHPLFASTGGTQQFVWSDRLSLSSADYTGDWHPDDFYDGSYLYRAGPPDAVFAGRQGGSPGIRQVTDSSGRNVTGRYEVIFHGDPFKRQQAQAVAYGSSNVRCKFTRRLQPRLIENAARPGTWFWAASAEVGCHTPDGAAQNSLFVISYSGQTPTNNPTLKGPAAFFETSGTGAQIAKLWVVGSNGAVVEGTSRSFFNSEGGRPTIEHRDVGHYRVTLPGLGITPLGVTQVTAIGPGAIHCKPGGTGNSSNWNLTIDVYCYNRDVRADSDLSFNYDAYVTRQSTAYQGARAYPNLTTYAGPYTPTRSYNSGLYAGGTMGTNSAGRYAQGWYYLRHTQLGHQHSSVFVVAAGANSTYCKVEWWGIVIGTTGPTEVRTRCFDASGYPADAAYMETYQGSVLAPI